jgi:hypothetical protein
LKKSFHYSKCNCRYSCQFFTSESMYLQKQDKSLLFSILFTQFASVYTQYIGRKTKIWVLESPGRSDGDLYGGMSAVCGLPTLMDKHM